MTGARRGGGRRRRRHTGAEPGSWLPAAFTDAACAHEPDTTRIRGRIIGPGSEARSSPYHPESRHCTTHDRRRKPGSGATIRRRGRLRTAARRPTAIAFGTAAGVLGVVAITMIGMRVIPSHDQDQPISATALPMPPAGSTTATSSPPAATPQQPASTGPATRTTTDTAATPLPAQASTNGAPQVQLSIGPMTKERITLPAAGIRDWVLYGHSTNRSVGERVRANLPKPIIGRLDMIGADPTVVPGTSRFGWSGGSPQQTGRNHADALALRASGEFRLTVPITGQAGHLNLYLGTLGVQGAVRADIDGKTVSSAVVQPVVQSGRPSRWVGSIIEIDFYPNAGEHTLTLSVSAVDEPDQDDQGSQGDQESQDGGRPPRQPQTRSSPGQISLAAAILFDGQ
ncbi:hypothetical protein [Protofrankia symbiont of Coriaria ruscifolia]|uniref:hypothetical protein n=1 Tax=Protofrankia symbiont of Coriaria ruscifolia TaxID=1306542 RepID=UPI00104176A7|nr:hypothetical protein [Protofrankia symbiont of Coriaria ruscifolia]